MGVLFLSKILIVKMCHPVCAGQMCKMTRPMNGNPICIRTKTVV